MAGKKLEIVKKIVAEWKAAGSNMDQVITFGNLKGNSPRNIKRIMSSHFPDIPYVLNHDSHFFVMIGKENITPLVNNRT